MRPCLAPFVALLAASCIDAGPPAWAPNPESTGATTEACARAKALRERAPRLLEEGRLDRATRALSRAEDLCPAEAPATWALRVRALAELGRVSEALQLAARIERSDRADDAARAAAAAARAMAEERGRSIADRGSRRDAPELFDPAEKRRADAAVVYARAAEAAGAGDHEAAKRLYLAAWEAARTDPIALVAAGLEASAEGRRAEAQALWDRAAYDDPTLAPRPAIVDGAPPSHGPTAIAWAPAGDRVAVSGDQRILVLDRALRPTLRLAARERVTALAFASDGLRVYAGLEGGAVQVFDAATGAARRDLAGHRAAVRAIAASPDGRRIATGSDDGSVRVWDASGAPVGAALEPAAKGPASHRRAPAPVTRIAFDASGTRLAAADEDGRVELHCGDAGGPMATCGEIRARGDAVRAMTFTAPATLEVVTAVERIRYDVTTPKRPRGLPAARVRCEAASIAAAGDHAVVASEDAAKLELTDLAGKAPGATMPREAHGGVLAFALAPAGKALALVYRDRTLALVSATGEEPPRELAPAGAVDALAASGDGATLAATVGGRAYAWHPAGERLRAYEPGVVRAIALAPDGRTLAMGLESGRVVVRDLDPRAPERAFAANAAVELLSFSPDGARLVAGTRAPSVQTFALGAVGDTATLAVDSGPVRAARFAKDGATVLVASKDGLSLWKPSSHEAARLVPYGAEVRDAAFAPDGAGILVVNRRGELVMGKLVASAPPALQTVPVPAQALALAVAADGTLATAEGDRSIALRSPSGKGIHRFRDPDASVRAIGFLKGTVAAGLSDGSLRLYRAPETGPVAILRVAPGLPPGKVAGVVSGPRGHLEIVGPDADAGRASVRCQVGAVLFPLEVCAEQFVVQGLHAMVLAGKDPAEADP